MRFRGCDSVVSVMFAKQRLSAVGRFCSLGSPSGSIDARLSRRNPRLPQTLLRNQVTPFDTLRMVILRESIDFS